MFIPSKLIHVKATGLVWAGCLSFTLVSVEKHETPEVIQTYLDISDGFNCSTKMPLDFHREMKNYFFLSWLEFSKLKVILSYQFPFEDTAKNVTVFA